MEYESFVKQFMEELKQNMEQEGVELQRHEVIKNNGVVKDGITIKYPDSPVAPTIYADELYEMVNDGYSIAEMAEKEARKLESMKTSMPKAPVLTQENAMENLYCVVVNTEANEEMLKNVPHENIEDLSVVARYRVGEDGSFLVTNEICKTLQMTSEEVMEAAHANTDHQEYKCQTMGEVMREMMLKYGMPEEYADELIQMQGDQCPMWVLTNNTKVDGAVAITSQETLNKVHEKLGEDFYVLPSSRHEVIIVPQRFVPDVQDLKDMVHTVNETEVSKTDKLSDSVYRYDGRKLTIADAPTEKMSEAITEELSKGHTRSH